MATDDYAKIAAAIRFIRKEANNQPKLATVAAHIGLSPFHLQRLFQRWAGVSPKRFLQYLTSQHAKQLLRQAQPLLETSYAVGLSSAGRLHDLFVAIDAVTPGEFSSRGEGLTINWGIHPGPFGDCLIGLTTRGILALQFVDQDPQPVLQRLKHDWPKARLSKDERLTGATLREVFALLTREQQRPLPLLLRGTNFQLRVWQALLQIPAGQISTYAQIARHIGSPGSARAVGSAIGQNPIAWLIPCHRVLRTDGGLGGYRWGEERKLAILGQEFAHTEAD